jgi:hypothetical protein
VKIFRAITRLLGALREELSGSVSGSTVSVTIRFAQPCGTGIWMT